MAGGSGTRLWPLSRAQLPEAVPRAAGQPQPVPAGRAARWPRCARADIAVARAVRRRQRGASLPGARPAARARAADAAPLLLEPTGRNTAPAHDAGRAAGATEAGADPVLVVTPADQTVTDAAAFTRGAAAGGARGGRRRDRDPRRHAGPARDRLRLHPLRPRARRDSGAAGARSSSRSPTCDDRASAICAEGGYYWNSGMFVVRASVWLEALERFRARHRRRHARRLGTRAASTPASCGPARPSSPRSRASRSTTR